VEARERGAAASETVLGRFSWPAMAARGEIRMFLLVLPQLLSDGVVGVVVLFWGDRTLSLFLCPDVISSRG
jgi:hypothetical protein